MIVIVAITAALVVFAIGFVAGRQLRPGGSRLTPAWWAAIGCTAIVLVGSTVLYVFLSSPSWSGSPRPNAPASRDSPPGAPVIEVKVELAAALQPRAPRAAPLYVFVRDPAQGGPPLAVKRLQSRFPQTVVLTSSDAMIQGHAITAGERVEVIARISPSGDAMDQSGDLSGQAAYRVGRDGLVDVVIDHVTP